MRLRRRLLRSCLPRSAHKLTELGLGAACDTAGAREFGDTEVKEGSGVGCEVVGCETRPRCRTCAPRVSGQRWASPVADSASVNTSPTVEKALNVVFHRVAMEATQKGCRCITLLGNFVVAVRRTTRECGRISHRRSPQRATHNESRQSPCASANEGLRDGEGDSARLKRVLVEQDGQVVAVSVGMELASDVRNVVTSFLEDRRVEAATGGTEGLCGPLASQAGVPLEHEEAIPTVPVIAYRIGERDVKVGLGNTKP